MEHQLVINAPLCLSTFYVMMSYEEALKDALRKHVIGYTYP